MTKIIVATLIVLSTLSGNTIVAQADYFGGWKQTQEGQLLPGIFGQIEKSGI